MQIYLQPENRLQYDPNKISLYSGEAYVVIVVLKIKSQLFNIKAPQSRPATLNFSLETEK
jgi:hypothetical protein